jgi:hypothetical protein
LVGAHAADMETGDIREDVARVAELACTEGEIDVFQVHEEALVEALQRLEDGTPDSWIDPGNKWARPVIFAAHIPNVGNRQHENSSLPSSLTMRAPQMPTAAFDGSRMNATVRSIVSRTTRVSGLRSRMNSELPSRAPWFDAAPKPRFTEFRTIWIGNGRSSTPWRESSCEALSTITIRPRSKLRLSDWPMEARHSRRCFPVFQLTITTSTVGSDALTTGSDRSTVESDSITSA